MNVLKCVCESGALFSMYHPVVAQYRNPLYNGGLFQYYVLDEFTRQFRVSVLFSLYSIFDEKGVSQQCRPWSDVI